MAAQRFSFLIAGDSGDGIQLMGQQSVASLALAGHSVKTVSFFPAEIRAPAGTIHGVSAYQVCFSHEKLYAPSDKVDALIAFNPAAYWMSKEKLADDGVLIYDEQLWQEKHWKKAGLDFVDPEKIAHRTIKIPLSELTIETCQDYSLTFAQAKKNRNFTAIGVVLWLSQLPLESGYRWLEKKFQAQQGLLQVAKACAATGYNLAETLELPSFELSSKIFARVIEQRRSQTLLTGNQALVLALVLMAERTRRKVALFGYPITPASEILEYAQRYPQALQVAQAEDEMAALGMSLGAAWGGALSVSCTSGPGFDLKAEMLGLAVSAQLPCVVINVQRAGPSTGLPTKVEQADLLSALWGRHGDCPIPVLAPCSAQDCLERLMQACLWAIKAQTPVIVLSDAALAQSSAQVDLHSLPTDMVSLPSVKACKASFEQQYAHEHDKIWTIPGQEDRQHCLTGLEVDSLTGQISYDGPNHQVMTGKRTSKLASLAQECRGAPPHDSEHRLLFISFGSSCGPIRQWLEDNPDVSADFWALTMLYPLPINFMTIAQRYDTIVIVEMNQGQLMRYLKSEGLGQYACLVSWQWQQASLFSTQWLEEQYAALLKGGV